MLVDLFLFGCEGFIPNAPPEPWWVEVSEVHPSGKAAIAKLNLSLEVAPGESTRTFILTPRHVGKTIEMAETNVVVVYLHPYRDDEALSLEAIDIDVPSRGISSAIGFCMLTSRETAINRYNLRLEGE